MDTIKKYLPHAVMLLLGAEVDKPIYVQGAATTETKTQIAYVPKETIIERYIDASGNNDFCSRTKRIK